MLDRLVQLVLDFIKVFQFCKTIYPWQAGLRIRLGKYQATLGPGVHLMFPLWIDAIIRDNVVAETMRTKPQSLITKDGKAIVVSAVVTFCIEDVKTFLLDVEGRNNVVEDSTYGATSKFIMSNTWEELSQMDAVDNELAKAIRRQAKRYGVGIIQVQLADFTPCRSLRLIGMSNDNTLLKEAV